MMDYNILLLSQVQVARDALTEWKNLNKAYVSMFVISNDGSFLVPDSRVMELVDEKGQKFMEELKRLAEIKAICDQHKKEQENGDGI